MSPVAICCLLPRVLRAGRGRLGIGLSLPVASVGRRRRVGGIKGRQHYRDVNDPLRTIGICYKLLKFVKSAQRIRENFLIKSATLKSNRRIIARRSAGFFKSRTTAP